MEENKYSVEFMIISYAGNAKAMADEAVELATKGDFEDAKEKLSQAEECLVHAHQSQTDMIFNAVNGEKLDMNIFLVHAQDHLTMGTMAIDNAKKFIDLYKVVINK